MSYAYPSPPQCASDHGSVCSIDNVFDIAAFQDVTTSDLDQAAYDLFDVAAFDHDILEASATIPTVRCEVSRIPSSSNLNQATYDLFCDNADFGTHVADQPSLGAATTDSSKHVDISEESMAELLKRFLDQDRLENPSVQQVEQPPDIVEKTSKDRNLKRAKSAHKQRKRARSEDSNFKPSASVKRLRSGLCPPKNHCRQLRTRKNQLQSPDHALDRLPLQTRANTQNEHSNHHVNRCEASHQEDLSMPMTQNSFANEELGRTPLRTEFSEFSNSAISDTTTTLDPGGCERDFSMNSISSASDMNAPTMFNMNAAELSPEPLFPAPAPAHIIFQGSTDRNYDNCMHCNIVTHRSGDPAYFGVKAGVLPLCGHFVCHTCITHYYDLKGEYNSCIYCPICDSFSGSLEISDASLPTLSRDLHYLLYKTRQLPQEYFATQQVSINVKEASVVLKSVFRIIAGEFGFEGILTTASLLPDRLYTSLDASLQNRRNNDVTSVEDLRAVLLECIGTRAVDELGRCYGRAWLRSRFGHKNQTYRWRELKAALERDLIHPAELQAMQAWTFIVYGVVGVLTLRWKHRLDAFLSSVDCNKSEDHFSLSEGY